MNPHFEALVNDIQSARQRQATDEAIDEWEGYANRMKTQRDAARAELAAAQAELSQLKEALAQREAALEQKTKAYDTLVETNVWNYAEKVAFRKALTVFDPTHPLVDPGSGNPLVSSLRRQAMRAYVFAGGNMDEVSNVAGLFDYRDSNPSRPPRGLLEGYQGHRQALETAWSRMNDPQRLEYARRALEATSRQPR